MSKQSLDPRVVLTVKFFSFFLIVLTIIGILAMVLVPIGDLRVQNYEAKVLQGLSSGQVLGNPRDIDDPQLPELVSLIPMEDGRSILIIQSQHNLRPMNIAVRYSSDGIPEILHPIDSPLYGRLRYYFPGGIIPENYKPGMGLRILELYRLMNLGKFWVTEGSGL